MGYEQNEEENPTLSQKIVRFMSPYNKEIHFRRGMRFSTDDVTSPLRELPESSSMKEGWHNVSQLILNENWMSFK